MGTSRKLKNIQEANRLLEKRYLKEDMNPNLVQLVKDIIGFFGNLNIMPGPIESVGLLRKLYGSDNPSQILKDYVKDKIPRPDQRWEKIEGDLDRLGGDIANFKAALVQEFKKRLGI